MKICVRLRGGNIGGRRVQPADLVEMWKLVTTSLFKGFIYRDALSKGLQDLAELLGI